MEIFKDIQGYKKKYQVSNLGNVTSTFKKGQQLGKFLTHRGYLQVSLCIKSKQSSFPVHKLVMNHFGVEPIGDCNHVNHINGIRTDNRIENLEWVSNRENASHSLVRQAKRTSKYPGVCFSTSHSRYIAQVYHNKKNVYLGLFENEETAYEAVKQFHTENQIINRYI